MFKVLERMNEYMRHSLCLQRVYNVVVEGEQTKYNARWSKISWNSVVLVDQSCPIFATLWTVAHRAPLSIGFPRQENWSGLPFPSPRALHDPGIKPTSPALQVDSLPLSHLGSPTTCTSCGELGLVYGWSDEKWKLLSCVRLFATPWTIQSVEFSRPEYWSG